MEGTLLIADSSTLLNFLKLGRVDLLHGLGFKIRVVDAVDAEIQTERKELDRLIREGVIKVISLDGAVVRDSVAAFLRVGLGAGEAFSFAAAVEYDCTLAIDDARAIKRAKPVAVHITILTSVDIIVANINAKTLSIEEADALKAEWEKNRFLLKFKSFADLINRE